MLIWDIGFPLQKAIRDYMEAAGPDLAVLDVKADLLSNNFVYQHLSKAQRATIQQQEQVQNTQDDKQRQQRLRQMLAVDTAPFGNALAETVAEALKYGGLGLSHRDYCGLGLELKDGSYRYGELYDGYMMQAIHTFADRESFVNWLARQSNASLSRIEQPDAWTWGNQVITRQRLEEFTHNLSR